LENIFDNSYFKFNNFTVKNDGFTDNTKRKTKEEKKLEAIAETKFSYGGEFEYYVLDQICNRILARMIILQNRLYEGKDEE
jgi:hypothetical protein